MKTEKPSRQNATRKLNALLSQFHGRRNVREVFCDFTAAAALALEQVVAHAEGRFDESVEAEYERIERRYDKNEFSLFPQMFAITAHGLERPCDFLGEAYMSLEIRNRHTGQFFTPWSVASLMARMCGGTPEESIANANGKPVALCDPACGSGVMTIAAADCYRSAGYEPLRYINATLTDIDRTCVDICYIQTTLLFIPATVIHGNSLSGETFGTRRNLPLLLQESNTSLSPLQMMAMLSRSIHNKPRTDKATKSGQKRRPTAASVTGDA